MRNKFKDDTQIKYYKRNSRRHETGLATDWYVQEWKGPEDMTTPGSQGANHWLGRY